MEIKKFLVCRDEPYGGIIFNQKTGYTFKVDKELFSTAINYFKEEKIQNQDVITKIKFMSNGCHNIFYLKAKNFLSSSNLEFSTSPEIVSFSITNYCTRGCEFCYSNSTPSGSFFNIENLPRLIKQLILNRVLQVTIGGGEPLWQADFVYELLKRCRVRGIDTAIETCGYADWKSIEKVCTYANLVVYDIKHIDSSKHKARTGHGNELILENLKQLSSSFPETPIILRTPVIPGFNDSSEVITAIKDSITGLSSVRKYELLPYHGFGESKYQQLGREYSLAGLEPPSEEHMTKLRGIISA